jgi:hypothetical protein
MLVAQSIFWKSLAAISILSTQNTNVSVFPNLKVSVLGLGGGRARSPSVAQRPTDARNTDGLNCSQYFT